MKRSGSESHKRNTSAEKSVSSRNSSRIPSRGRIASRSEGRKESLSVAIRMRPTLAEEETSTKVVQFFEEEHKVRVHTHGSSSVDCTFDRIFPPTASQSDVYAFVQPMIFKVTAGINFTVFAYGQTGTGKTHTMLGDSSTTFREIHANCGIIPRAMVDIFDCLAAQQALSRGNRSESGLNTPDTKTNPSGLQSIVKCSYLQIYNEKLYDLLVDRKKSNRLVLRERQDPSNTGESVHIEGLTSICVENAEDVLKLLRLGRANRAVRGTEFNARSSRSHAILQVRIQIRNSSPDDSPDVVTTSSKMNLVDLAGSEKWNTNVDMHDCHEQELRQINRSLSALGNCIAALTEHGRKHIPYRDSMLTRLLRDSLGGNTCTVLIATITGASNAAEETIRTLQFADRAKSVMQRVKVNVSVNGSKRLASAMEEISNLQKQLKSLREMSEAQSATREDVSVEKMMAHFEHDISKKQNEIESLSAKNASYVALLEDNGSRIVQLENMLRQMKDKSLWNMSFPSRENSPTSDSDIALYQRPNSNDTASSYRPESGSRDSDISRIPSPSREGSPSTGTPRTGTARDYQTGTPEGLRPDSGVSFNPSLESEISFFQQGEFQVVSPPQMQTSSQFSILPKEKDNLLSNDDQLESSWSIPGSNLDNSTFDVKKTVQIPFRNHSESEYEEEWEEESNCHSPEKDARDQGQHYPKQSGSRSVPRQEEAFQTVQSRQFTKLHSVGKQRHQKGHNSVKEEEDELIRRSPDKPRGARMKYYNDGHKVHSRDRTSDQRRHLKEDDIHRRKNPHVSSDNGRQWEPRREKQVYREESGLDYEQYDFHSVYENRNSGRERQNTHFLEESSNVRQQQTYREPSHDPSYNQPLDNWKQKQADWNQKQAQHVSQQQYQQQYETSNSQSRNIQPSLGFQAHGRQEPYIAPVSSHSPESQQHTKSSICTRHKLSGCVLCEMKKTDASSTPRVPLSFSYRPPLAPTTVTNPLLGQGSSHLSTSSLLSLKNTSFSSSKRCEIHHLSDCILCGRSQGRVEPSPITSSKQLSFPPSLYAKPSSDIIPCKRHRLLKCILCSETVLTTDVPLRPVLQFKSKSIESVPIDRFERHDAPEVDSTARASSIRSELESRGEVSTYRSEQTASPPISSSERGYDETQPNQREEKEAVNLPTLTKFTRRKLKNKNNEWKTNHALNTVQKQHVIKKTSGTDIRKARARDAIIAANAAISAPSRRQR